MVTKEEKKFLKQMVGDELKRLRKGSKLMFVDIALPFLKGEHEYADFLANLLKKLK